MNFLPTTPEEVKKLGWDAVDVVLVTGDAYVDHPSFAMALVGRVLEAEGLRVAILAQPRWESCADFRKFGRPRLFFGVSSGNMDSMINKYTHNRKIRSTDDFSPGARPGQRPDRAAIIYSQRAREAYPDAPIVVGGI
ncbi:MAG: YgiQ family radical SAM protein, partial [Elusimicrobiota bacterium]|nr:YgiQ family radical SAM protein [Elusimicrobiota bacterium]